MKRSQFLKCQPCPMPEGECEEVTAVSQIVTSGEEQAVEISLFYKGSLRGRYFADADNYNFHIDGKWHTCRLENAARLCKDRTPLKNDYYYYGKELVWASEEDRERAIDFLDAWSMDSYENGVNARKQRQAAERKQERINRQMREVPCVPDDAERWLDQVIFPEHILFVRKGKDRSIYSCTACQSSSWRKKGWKHGEKTVCPKCGQPVTVNRRRQEKEKKAPIVILQQYADRWVERQFRSVCRWTPDGKEIKLFEECRAVIPQGACWGKVWYGTLYDEDEYGQEFWDKNPANKRFLSSYLYPGNLQEVLKCGGLERSGMDIMAEKGQKFRVNILITTFHQRQYVEYLAKAGLTRLVADILEFYGWYYEPEEVICTYADHIQDAVKLDGNRVNRLRQMNGGIRALEWLQYEQETRIKISQESLEYLQDRNVSVEDCRDILEELKSVNRMVNYMRKQKISANKIAGTWRDYLRMAKAEGYDTTDDIVRFPRDLKARHDHMVELGDKRADAERLKGYAGLDAQIRERLPQVKRYFYEDDTYMIIPAGGCGELMQEGRTLHHCVGRDDFYMKRMAAGTSWILFLRKKEDIKKAYYTIEIDMKDDRILQYRSKFNRQPDKETISRVLDRFRRSIKRSGQQAHIQVPVAATA